MPILSAHAGTPWTSLGTMLALATLTVGCTAAPATQDAGPSTDADPMAPDSQTDGAPTVLDAAVDNPCDGPQPALADCVHGGAWAECGGTVGGPVFACSSVCFWFEHGCVAEGFTASTCPAEDLCCIDDYPYGGEWRDSGHSGAYMSLYEWGVHPWDRTRERIIGLTIAPLAPAPSVVECSGIADAAFGPCGTVSSAAGGPRTSSGGVFTTNVRSPSVAIVFWTLSIEVTRDVDASLHARVCRLPSTDYASTYQCSPFADPPCAVSGTLTLDAFPEDAAAAALARLQLHAVFADGAIIDAQL